MTGPVGIVLVCVVSFVSGYIGASVPFWLDPAWRAQRREEKRRQRDLLATLTEASSWLECHRGST